MTRIQRVGIGLLSLVLAACSTHHPLENRVTVSNYKDVTLPHQQAASEPIRFWASEQPTFLYNKHTGTTPLTATGEQLNILALSGGGANGAYGAGVLTGLHDNGDLPHYTIITGVSAGALIAPFVFAGDSELPRLKSAMLGINDKAVLGSKNFLNTLFKDSFSDGDSLLAFIARTYPEAMIDKMAMSHRAGKRLFIGTTHFDSGELMIWNLGAIASSSMPNRVQLVHQVLAASASIPGVFPPQFIAVEHQGQRLEELHVDGGLAAQMFFNPADFDYQQVSRALGLSREPQLHVVRNGLLAPLYQRTEDKGLKLLTRSLTSLTVLQARGDLFRMRYLSEIEQIDLHYTYLDEDFSAQKLSGKMFDVNYMQAIYRHGYHKAATGQVWQQ